MFSRDDKGVICDQNGIIEKRRGQIEILNLKRWQILAVRPFGSEITCSGSCGSINTDNLYAVTNPIRGQIDPAAVAAGFNYFLNQFFAVNLKFNLFSLNRFTSVSVAGYIICFDFFRHFVNSFPACMLFDAHLG